MILNKKTVFFAMLFFAKATSVFAQSENNILTTASYVVSYTINGKIVINDLCLLDITKTQSYFYSKNVAEASAKLSEKRALAEAQGAEEIFISRDDRPSSNAYRADVLKNYDKSNAIMIQGVGMQVLGYVKDPNLQKKWQIKDENLVVNGLKSQKAVVVKPDGTIVTAWFCKDIPLPDGPFSYFGLPGLITKLSTTDGLEAELTQIVKNTDPKKQIKVRENYSLVTEADFKKAAENAKANRGMGALPPGLSIKQAN